MWTDRQKGMVMLTSTLWEHFVVNTAKIVLEYISIPYFPAHKALFSPKNVT